MIENKKPIKICVVGLGYVGLPLAVEFSKHFNTYGFDVNEKKIEELKQGIERMNEVDEEVLKKAPISFSTDPKVIKDCNFICVSVPTPITDAKVPDLALVESASKLVGENLAAGSVIVFESTVYPGVTEKECVPIIEKYSNLKCGTDFKIGYSPERINPGDKEHTINKITKVVAGSDDETAELLAYVYGKVTKIFKAKSIMTAEAAKVIENVQRDLNIALMNELAQIFGRIGLNIYDVLEAARTKWNFLPFTPGLVGGHCIGVDPYYLTHLAEQLGHHPQIILAGRRINDNMHKHIADLIIKNLNKAGKVIKDSKIAILGLTFKENVNDSRNSRAKHLIEELKSYGANVMAHDPHLDNETVEKQFNIKHHNLEELKDLDLIALITPHSRLTELQIESLAKMMNQNNPVIFDLKNVLDKNECLKYGIKHISL